MGVQLSLHAGEVHRVIKALKEDRYRNIDEIDCGMRFLHGLNLSGKERRPFTKEELQALMTRYKLFERAFHGIVP
jgi:hypothetical protein